MKNKLINNLLLFSVFGIALGFFGMLYEGLVLIPKMMDVSMERMLFWKDFYAFINPVIYYIPLTPLATIVLVGLYFMMPRENVLQKKRLGLAAILQITVMAFTFYIVTQVNLKMYFSDIEKYAGVIPGKVLLVNILSVVRLMFGAAALTLVFKGYIQNQRASLI